MRIDEGLRRFGMSGERERTSSANSTLKSTLKISTNSTHRFRLKIFTDFFIENHL